MDPSRTIELMVLLVVSVAALSVVVAYWKVRGYAS